MKQWEDDDSYSDSDMIQMKVQSKEDLASDKKIKIKSNPKLRKNHSNKWYSSNEGSMHSNSTFHQGRRPTIFDCLNDEYMENDSRANLLNFKEITEKESDDENKEDNEPYVTRMDAKIRSSCSSALKEKTHNEKRVDFNVTVCEEPPHNPPKNASHSLPKSSLKHFSIDTRGLMSQNVDETEEYEHINKESGKLSKFNREGREQDSSTEILIQPNLAFSSLNSENIASGTNNATQMHRPQSNSKETPFSKSEQEVPASIKSKKQKKEFGKGKKSLNHRIPKNLYKLQPKEVFIELQNYQQVDDSNNIHSDLPLYEWKEVARWIKYEQTIDLETNVWGRPCVGALVYQSLLYLKTGLQYGTVILNSTDDSLEEVIDEMVQDFIDSGHMYKENREKIKNTMLTSHSHYVSNSAMTRKKSSISLAFTGNRRQSTFNDLLSSGSSSRKNSSSINELSNRVKSENKLLSISDINLENGFQNITKTDSASKNFMPDNSKRRRSTIALIKGSMGQSNRNKSELNLKGIDTDAEACVIKVGVVDFLDRPVMAFIRLKNSQLIDEMVEVKLKVRFLFVLLGPKNDSIDYLEIGRCVGTLMTNKDFHECAYRATDRRELIDTISKFTNRSLCLVLPVGNFDEDVLAPIVEWMRDKMNKKSIKSTSDDVQIFDKNSPSDQKLSEHLEEQEEESDPFQKTDRLFGCLINEIKHRYKFYLNDFKDALNLHCLIAFVFIFTVCFAPALSFGGILADKTEKSFGVNEMLLATSLNGIIAGLFSGQPLMIYGATGPFLVFEEMLYYFCNYFCVEYLAVRCWVGMWVLFFCLILLAFEMVYIIKYVTRFTEEIFAFLIASVFLNDAIKKIVKIFYVDPLYTTEKYCSLGNQTNFYSNQTSNNDTCILYRSYDDEDPIRHVAAPNRALISLLSLIGTCMIALALKKLRRSVFFGSYIRRTLSDVGMFISIVLMVFVDYIIENRTGIVTKKLDIPDDFYHPSNGDRISWFIKPFGNNFINGSSSFIPLWVPIASIFPAFLIFIVLYFEVEVTELILHSKHRMLKKGPGFNLDILIAAMMMTLNSFLGLPWMCAAPVRTLAHWASLTVYSSNYIPGEKQKLILVREQRLTNICVHIAIGLCLLAKGTLKMIPVSVLFGIFLYFGIVSLSGTQLYERIKLIFIPSKYCPNVVYARGVRPSKRNLFTIIQITAVFVLLVMKSFNQISFTFPIVLVLLVPLRNVILPKIFTNKELEQLDHSKESNSDMDLDFYELTHLPI